MPTAPTVPQAQKLTIFRPLTEAQNVPLSGFERPDSPPNEPFELLTEAPIASKLALFGPHFDPNWLFWDQILTQIWTHIWTQVAIWTHLDPPTLGPRLGPSLDPTSSSIVTVRTKLLIQAWTPLADYTCPLVSVCKWLLRTDSKAINFIDSHTLL